MYYALLNINLMEKFLKERLGLFYLMYQFSVWCSFLGLKFVIDVRLGTVICLYTMKPTWQVSVYTPFYIRNM